MDNQNEIIQVLAGLSPLEYEKQRIAEARRLKIRLSMLDDLVKKYRQQANEETQGGIIFPSVEPWPDPVCGASLLTNLSLLIRKFVILEESESNAISLWVLFTHCIDAARIAPILNINSPEKRCGKSTLLSLIESLVHKPLLASNITPAAIFRTIEEYKPTLLLDEVDTFVDNERSELRGIINSGHSRSSAFVIRTVGENHTPQKFTTWGAKCLAGIGNLPETIKDRSIGIKLRRKIQHEIVASLRYTDKNEIIVLKSKCARFAIDNIFTLQSHQPTLPRELNDRAADNWEPLLAIADKAGGDWPEIAKKAALSLSVDEDTFSLSTELLVDIKNIFETKNLTRISSAELLTALCMDSESPWVTYNRGKPITTRQLAKRLKEFQLSSGSIRLPNGTTPKGYYRKDFDDVFTRYLPPEDATTPQFY